jgi:hypothetical protein
MAAFIIALFALASTMAEAGPRDGFWERELRVFAVEDRKAEPIKGGVVFLGSSSIRLWPTEIQTSAAIAVTAQHRLESSLPIISPH